MELRFCSKCGALLNTPEDKFCYVCGAEQKSTKKKKIKKQNSNIGKFFILLAQCLGFFGFYFVVSQFIMTIYGVIMLLQSGRYFDIISSSNYQQEFTQLMSKYYAEVGIGVYILVLVCYFLFYKIRHKSLFKEIKVKKISVIHCISALLIGVSAQFVISIGLSMIYTMFPTLQKFSVSDSLEQSFSNSNFVMEFIFIAVFAPIFEEILFRGLIHNRLRRVLPVGACVFLSSIIFGAAHMNIEQFVYASIFGIVLAFIYEKTGSIFASMLVHFAFNGSSYILTLLDVSDMILTLIFLVSISILVISIALTFGLRREEVKNEVI